MDLYAVLDQHLTIIGIAFFFSLVNGTLAWKLGYFNLPSLISFQKISGWHVMGIFAIFIGAQLFFVPLTAIGFFSFLEGDLIDPTKFKLNSYQLGWLTVYSVFISVFSVIGCCFLVRRETLKEVFRPNFKANNLMMGIISWFVAYPIVLLFGQIVAMIVSLIYKAPPLEQVAVRQLKATEEFPEIFWSLVVGIVILVPIIEEIIFRGFLQSWFYRFFGRKAAILGASMIFAIFHLSSSQGIDNFELITSLFILSCFLGFIYERENSLLAPIGLHITFNFISVAQIFFNS